MENIKLLYIDLFCGAGGTSTGVENARENKMKCAKVIACVNHDANAIASHSANHPDAMHFTEDIRTLELSPLVEHIEKWKTICPQARVVLWASLECTNFSKAKGGMPRDADSRTLAEHLFRYVDAISPDYIQIENVEEFMSWGDMDKNGKPISKDKGKSYLRWVKKMKSYGYDYDWRILNAADYGAYTSRKRFFGIFGKNGLPITFPVPTHCKAGKKDIFSGLEKWRPVKEVLDLSDEGKSIFDRKKPLVENSLERIYAGLVKFVAEGKDAFIVKYNSMNKLGKYQAPGIEEPCPVVATQNRLGLTKVNFLCKQFSGHPDSKNITIEEPAGAITCKDHHYLISACFVDNVQPFFMNQYSGGGCISSLAQPCPAVTTNPKQNLITPIFAVAKSDLSKTVKKGKKHYYLMNPQFNSKGGSIENPCFTLIARMDKMPPYLIITEEGDMGIEIYSTDSPMTRKIKEFMALYGIIDIKMRMLKIEELKRIMGFPDTYVLIGTQAEQKKYIGNAVEVNMARVLCEAICYRLKGKRRYLRSA